MSEWQETEYGRVPSKWQVLTLSEISEKITDGSHLSPKPQTSGKYMCSVKDMTYNRFDFSDCKLISLDDFNKLVAQGCQPRNGDILISKDGANCLDLIFVFNQKEELVLLSSIAIVRLLSNYNSVFVRYFLLAPDCQYVMRNNFISGSAIPRVVLKDFKRVLILIPPLPEQKAIAAVLSSLDDKIDLLHRQNKTLEAMAETLFKQWFVVEAREDSETGKISDLVEFNPVRQLSRGTIAPYLEMAALSTQVFHPSNWYDREFSSGTKFINGDTLLARITPCLENGKSAYVSFLKDNQVGWGSTEYIVMRSKLGLHPFFTYALAKNLEFRDYAEGCLSGSSGRQRVEMNHLKNYEIIIPSKNVIDKFNEIISPIAPKLHNNFIQIRTLETLRDNLLPKLMSGEVRVKTDKRGINHASLL